MAFKCDICGEEDLGHQIIYCWRCQPERYKKDKGE